MIRMSMNGQPIWGNRALIAVCTLALLLFVYGMYQSTTRKTGDVPSQSDTALKPIPVVRATQKASQSVRDMCSRSALIDGSVLEVHMPDTTVIPIYEQQPVDLQGSVTCTSGSSIDESVYIDPTGRYVFYYVSTYEGGGTHIYMLHARKEYDISSDISTRTQLQHDTVTFAPDGTFAALIGRVTGYDGGIHSIAIFNMDNSSLKLISIPADFSCVDTNTCVAGEVYSVTIRDIVGHVVTFVVTYVASSDSRMVTQTYTYNTDTSVLQVL